jgi:AcrR family transcriptional regulator
VGAARGRPRSLAARRAVLEAARALVEKGGYAAATIEAISERSGVAKTTIYRSWPNRPALVVDLLMEMAGTAVPPPAVCPDPLKALRTEMHGIGQASDHITGRLLTSLLGEAQHDPEIRAALLDGLFRPRTDATSKVIRSAQRSGLLRKDVPARLAVDLLVGPIFYRMFVRHEPPSEAFVAHVFRVVMTGLEERR